MDIRKMTLPSDVKKLSLSEARELCTQIRSIIIDTVSKNGGHLASNLGSVELTLAIHRVFDSPNDKIVWDVGHQCYTHKILTGRLDKFSTLRQKDGISGFPKPCESAHDSFISGHSSNSISVACGIADALRLKNDTKHYAVAVIGDGAMTGGLAYEGLNNGGSTRNNLIVILNDNEKSISKNVGSLSKYLRNIRTKEGYVVTKQKIERKILRVPKIGRGLARAIKGTKDVLTSNFMNKEESTLFENLGFVYLGPVDGHDLKALEGALRAARSYHCPVLVHVNTVKGKGYAPAEENPGEYHGVSPFDKKKGIDITVKKEDFSSCFGRALTELAVKDSRICAITAAMKYGTGLQYFAKKFPDRFFDVGIAEEHAVTFAGGLASRGLIPVFAVYSSFLQRSFDELLHDVSIGRLHVVLGIDRAGVVGQDGETHQGMFDIGMLTNIPGTVIYSPASYEEVKTCLKKAVYDEKGLTAVRYPRGGESEIKISDNHEGYYYKGKKSDTLILSYGRIAVNAALAKDRLKEEAIAADFMKLTKIYPLSEEVKEVIGSYKKVFIFEETYKNSGIGNIICSELADRDTKFYVKNAENYLKQAPVETILCDIGLCPEKMADFVKENFGQ